jgi:hypothetical protein
MQRRGEDYLLAGDRLFIAGGVPIVIIDSSIPQIVSTGAVRLGKTVESEVESIEAWGHAEYWADRGICSTECWLPGEQPSTKELLRHCSPGTGAPAIEVIKPEPVDLFQIRVDAAFRIFRRRLFPGVNPSGAPNEDLGPFFERAHVHDAPQLTRRRITALSRSLDVLGTDWFLQRLGTSTMQCILGLIQFAAESPEFSPEESPLGELPEQLSAQDEAALPHL